MDPELRIAQGTLLAASPQMLDPNFMHAVVLMCQHAPQGAYGLVLNRLSGRVARKVLADQPLFSGVDAPIYLGGPVGRDTLQILHREPELIPGGVPIVDGVWLGGEIDAVGRFLAEGGEKAHDRVRLVVGYSGWGGGQLELELAAGAWIPAPATAGFVFTSDPELLWRNVLRSLGPDASGLESQPPDPRWN
jgi:putative transcriptional regulator